MTKELTPEELSELREELAWVIGNGQYGLRTMRIVTRIPDLINQIEATQEKMAKHEAVVESVKADLDIAIENSKTNRVAEWDGMSAYECELMLITLESLKDD